MTLDEGGAAGVGAGLVDQPLGGAAHGEASPVEMWMVRMVQSLMEISLLNLLYSTMHFWTAI
ncbi:MAG TPA: hypothetical protein VFG83_14690 [Kofleriaceae bacterium]|nr:hypothetical protein [Kofleriaceae bacterium]